MIISSPRWGVHLPTVDETCVRLVTPPVGAGDPWPLSRALVELEGSGVERTARPRAVGAGRNVPLITSVELRWGGHALEVESIHGGNGDEVTLHAPPWDELVLGEADEAAWWELVDRLATAVDATYGAIGDGEAIELVAPRGLGDLRRAIGDHVAVLVSEAMAADREADRAAVYRTLPHSRLAVLLR